MILLMLHLIMHLIIIPSLSFNLYIEAYPFAVHVYIVYNYYSRR